MNQMSDKLNSEGVLRGSSQLIADAIDVGGGLVSRREEILPVAEDLLGGTGGDLPDSTNSTKTNARFSPDRDEVVSQKSNDGTKGDVDNRSRQT